MIQVDYMIHFSYQPLLEKLDLDEFLTMMNNANIDVTSDPLWK